MPQATNMGDARPAMDDSRITQAEMIEMFGEAMPIEAVNLLHSAPDDWTLKQIRSRLREIAAERPPARPAMVTDAMIAAGVEYWHTHWGDQLLDDFVRSIYLAMQSAMNGDVVERVAKAMLDAAELEPRIFIQESEAETLARAAIASLLGSPEG